MIEKVSDNKKTLDIKSINKDIDYFYELSIQTDKIILKKDDVIGLKLFVLDFEKNSLLINKKKSNNEHNLFIKYFTQAIEDIESDKVEFTNLNITE